MFNKLFLIVMAFTVWVSGATLLWSETPSYPGASGNDWADRGGDKGGLKYSALDQINRENVKDLQVAWVYHAGDASADTNIECTPIVVGGIMYLTTADRKCVALDASTGKEKWRFDVLSVPYEGAPPAPSPGHGPPGLNRGVSYWHSGDKERIFLCFMDARLFSLDAKTGLPDPEFGQKGYLDLRKGLEYDVSEYVYGLSSPPAIFEDLVILPFATGEGGPPQAPGDVRAFDVHSGKEMWRFHVVPRPGEFGADTWPAGAWEKRGGANPWGGLTLDVGRGLLFAGTGSAGADHLGSDRHGQNLFANCVLALDARTGARRWHYQVVHHDIWDLDLPCPPVLLTLQRNGRPRDAVVQVGKTGFVYVFDRETGEPLFPIEERPVPKSSVEGEESWPTQPYPLAPPPFTRQTLTEEELTDISPEANAYARDQFLRHGRAGVFAPPGMSGSLNIPGHHGGATWAGASADPETCILYVAGNNQGWSKFHLDPEGNRRQMRKFVDQEGYPAVKPPWGTLTAIDLNAGTLVWQVPIGEYPELKARGVPPTGTENFAGTIVTKGGLVFAGGTIDRTFRAFDKTNGAILWEHALPASGYAQPATYAVNEKQYVVIAAGGGGKLSGRPGDPMETKTADDWSDAYVAFALP